MPIIVTVLHEGKTEEYQCDEGMLITELLEKIEIHPSTVLAVHEGVIVPHDSQLNGDLTLELIIVSSGG
tara:strand:+ start:39 stop:245 length:207 start_codon:yes stop_codon:yes gene_type:complete